VRLFPSIDKPDRIYVGFDDRLMATSLPTRALWPNPPRSRAWVHDIVQHPRRHLNPSRVPPANQATGNVRIVNGAVADGAERGALRGWHDIAEKPLRMRGTVREAIITGGSAVLAVDAESARS